MSKRFLAVFDSNYADEFDVSGFAIWDEEMVTEFDEAVKQYFKTHNELEIWFGTNESLLWESASEVIRSFKFTEISAEEETTLNKLFGKSYPGYFPYIWDYLDGEYD